MSIRVPAALAVLASGLTLGGQAHALTIYVDQTATYRYVNAQNADPAVVVPADWFTVGFNDSSWKSGAGPFSNTATSSTILNTANQAAPFAPNAADPIPATFTQWDAGLDPYLRTSFNLIAPTALTIWIAIDNGINSMYLNGVLATAAVNAEGNAFRWESVFDIPAAYTFAGANVLALQIEDHGGLTGFDLMVTADDAATNNPITTNPPPQQPTTPGLPEPGTLVLAGLGLAGIAWARRRKA